jgi:cytochrome P450
MTRSRRQRSSLSSTVVRAPGCWPLLGHIPAILNDHLGFLNSLPAYGDLVQIGIGPMRMVMACTPELTRQGLLNDATFDKGGPIFDRAREVMGNGMITCPHSAHRRQRRLVQPAFHHTRLPGYAAVMAEQITEVTGAWHDGQTIDVANEMQKIAARILLTTLYTDALPSAALSASLDDINTVVTGFAKRMFLPPILDQLPLPSNRRYQKARARLRSTISGIITRYRASGTDHGDLLSVLLTTREDSAADEATSRAEHCEPGLCLANREIQDQAITFLLAGTESTANTIAWALYLVARNPDLQQRLNTEVDSVLAGSAAAHWQLSDLQLTGRIITETLRLYPPNWLLTRVATTDTTLGAHAISAGTTLAFSPYLLHHRSNLYPAPDDFDPDRWLPQRRKTLPTCAFLPFGHGTRKCVGDTFAVAEATLALAQISAHWRLLPAVGPSSGRLVRPVLSATVKPPPLPMIAVRRYKS